MQEVENQSGRSDDNPETIKKRLDVYHNSTSPLRDYYKEQGKYHAIDGKGDVESIYNSIRDSLARNGFEN